MAVLLVRAGVIRYTPTVSDAGLSTPDRDQRIAALEAALATANAELAARDLLIETLRVQIARLRRLQFGASSERLSQQLAQLELALEELEVEAAVAEERKPTEARTERPRPTVRCRPTCRVKRSFTSRAVAPARARTAAASCACWVAMRTSSLMSFPCAGA